MCAITPLKNVRFLSFFYPSIAYMYYIVVKISKVFKPVIDIERWSLLFYCSRGPPHSKFLWGIKENLPHRKCSQIFRNNLFFVLFFIFIFRVPFTRHWTKCARKQSSENDDFVFGCSEECRDTFFMPTAHLSLYYFIFFFLVEFSKVRRRDKKK